VLICQLALRPLAGGIARADLRYLSGRETCLVAVLTAAGVSLRLSTVNANKAVAVLAQFAPPSWRIARSCTTAVRNQRNCRRTGTSSGNAAIGDGMSKLQWAAMLDWRRSNGMWAARAQ
jgi:hypothetical protein